MMRLRSTQDTYLKKTTTKSASELPKGQKHFVPKGKVLTIDDFKRFPSNKNYAAVTLGYGAGKWLAFVGHFENPDKLDTHNLTDDNKDIEGGSRSNVRFQDINWNDMNSKVSKYYTVGEHLRYDARRRPTSNTIKRNIYKLSQELDKIREAWGSAIVITSGYRPPAVNKAIGGAIRSQHLSGNAVDIKCVHGSILKFQKWLDASWNDALGYGARRGFVHIDIRSGGGWKSAKKNRVRWNY